DILYALPSIVFVIVIITTLETYFKGWLDRHFGSEIGARGRMVFLFVGLGAVSWLTMARIVLGQVLTLRKRQFVDASRSLGAGEAHILFRHILPNVLGVIIVYVTLIIPSIILYESFLSYLGMCVQPQCYSSPPTFPSSFFTSRSSAIWGWACSRRRQASGRSLPKAPRKS